MQSLPSAPQQIPSKGTFETKSEDCRQINTSLPTLKRKLTETGDACPRCQMPWIAANTKRSHELHSEKCNVIDYSNISACSMGLECDALNEEHYFSVNHLSSKSKLLNQGMSEDEVKKPLSDSFVFEEKCNGVWDWKVESGKDNVSTTSRINSSLSVQVLCKNSDEDTCLADMSDVVLLTQEHRHINFETSEDLFDRPRFSNPDFDSISQVRVDAADDAHTIEVSDESGSCQIFRSSVVEPVRDREIFPCDFDVEQNGGNAFILNRFFSKFDEASIKSCSTNLFNEQDINENIAANMTEIEMGKDSASDIKSDELAAYFGDELENHHKELKVDDSYEMESLTEAAKSHDASDLSCCSSKGIYCQSSDDHEQLKNIVEDVVKRRLRRTGDLRASALNPHLEPEDKAIHLHLEKGVLKNVLKKLKMTKSKTSSGKDANDRSCCSCGKTVNQNQASPETEAVTSQMEQSQRRAIVKENTAVFQDHTQRLHQYVQKRPPMKKKKKYGSDIFIPGTSFVVDAFAHEYLVEVKGFFLTHFHMQSYKGLDTSFEELVYCSSITAKLVNSQLGVSMEHLRPLPLDMPHIICDIEVTLLDANHCPGSVMILFKLRNGTSVLHVGDFRAHPNMESYPSFWNGNIDTVYLDTTYCRPMNDFPSQEEVIQNCVTIAVNHVLDNPSTVIVVGSYKIGKERVFREIASALDCFIWANENKQNIFRCIEDEEIASRLTSNKLLARVHVVPMKFIHPKKLADYIATLQPTFKVAVGLRPTGWEHCEDGSGLSGSMSAKQFGNVYVYGIPYSEHSSYPELKRFVKFLRPNKIVPTVSLGGKNTRKEVEQDFDTWLKI